MDLLRYRAGPEALERLRARGGLAASDVEALVLPAIGPKWLVLSGFDRALIGAGWLEPAAEAQRLMLFGASAGAWRALALAARDPLRAHAALLDSYCAQRFTRTDAPAISDAYRCLLRAAFEDADLAWAADHPRLDLAIATARARGALAQFEDRRAQAATLGAAALLNAFGARTQALFYERVVFVAGRGAKQHPLASAAHGRLAALTERNMLDVALASGTVPMYMQLVRDIEGAPAGAYLDGGFSDYHLNRPANGERITLLFLHQRRIIPSWLDKFLPWRKLDRRALSRLLLVYPSDGFVRSLPGSEIPTRDDFQRFLHEPERRIARWRDAAAQSTELGSEFLRDAESGRLAARVESF